MHSKLFVPAARPDLFEKALASAAGALSFDLEDAVPADDKAAARERLAGFLTSDAVRATGKTVIVRVNAPDSAHFAADIVLLTGVRVDLVNLPKIESAQAVSVAAEAIVAATAAVATPRLLVNIETPVAVRHAAAIAAGHALVAGLQVGLNDLFARLGADRRHAEHVHAALWSIRMAASEAGVFAYDGAWPDVMDMDGFKAEARLARSMGYLGKSCIHPRQIASANAIFDRGEDLAHARRLLAAAAAAAREGRGAFLLDGRMIDEPAIAQARLLLAGEGA